MRVMTLIRGMALLVGCLVTWPVAAAELAVCAEEGCAYSSLADAAAAAADGDTITLGPGIYQQAAVLRANNLTLRAAPGAHIKGAAAEHKAALVIKGDNVTIEGLECSDISVTNGNGACIRMEGRNLTLRNVYFHDAQQGLLAGKAGAPEKGVLLIEDSRFERLGFGARAHGIYVGEDDITLDIRRSRFVASNGQGHEIKSRARRTLIEDSVIASLDGVDGRLIDIPNGGELVVRGSILQKGPNSGSPDLIGAGLERGKSNSKDHQINSIIIENNTILLERGQRTELVHVEGIPDAILHQNKIIGGTPYTQSDNKWYIDLAAAHLERPKALTAAANDPAPTDLPQLYAFVERQLERTVSDVWVSRNYPRYLRPLDGWRKVEAKDWTSGFFPGALWLMHQATGDPMWRDWAEVWTVGLEGVRSEQSGHDIGFLVDRSFGLGFDITGNEAYRDVIVRAAEDLAGRYNPTVGAIRSWDWGRWTYPVIIDNMMNLELLFHAARIGGSDRLREIAVSHARRTAKDHIRGDGSFYHLVDYSPLIGTVHRKGTNQGADDESAWARGQAWAIYGFAVAHRETGDAQFLLTAQRAADYYIENLPEDGVPYWDFQARDIPHAKRDSSAAAAAASGLLLLADYVTDADAARYRASAVHTLETLSSPAYLALGSVQGGILRHGVGHMPGAREIDVSLIYGDYYFIEALTRLRGTDLVLDLSGPKAAVAESAPIATKSRPLASLVEPLRQISRLQMDAVGSEVLWREKSLVLAPAELAILRALVLRDGQPVPAATLSRVARNVDPSLGGDTRELRILLLSLREKFRAIDSGFDSIIFRPSYGYYWSEAL